MVLQWPQEPWVLDRFCSTLRCRVQCISNLMTDRDTYAAVGTRWETERPMYLEYDAVPASSGEGVRRLVSVQGGGGISSASLGLDY